jgi:hypothetical protein
MGREPDVATSDSIDMVPQCNRTLLLGGRVLFAVLVVLQWLQRINGLSPQCRQIEFHATGASCKLIDKATTAQQIQLLSVSQH